MTLALQDRVAIVTGAGMGMGEATALLFAEQGARVLIADIDAVAGEETAHAIAVAGGEAAFFKTDVSDEDQVEAMVAACVACFGRLDCAVNNAATRPDANPVAEASLGDFDWIIAVNLRSVLACMKHQIRQLLAQGSGGAIVNTGSINSRRPQPGSAAYTAAKHGVIGLTTTAAIEYADRGIRVNCVMPGAIDTPMIKQAMAATGATPDIIAPVLSLFNRLGTPREVAEANLWLCSDASSFVTGHALAVDAGYTAR